MKTVRLIADDIQRIFKGLPHLPEEVRSMLAKYLYAISLVLGTLSGFTLFYLLATVSGIAAFVSLNGINMPSDSINLILYLMLTATVATIALFFSAYKPLQAMREKGWLLLYIIGLISLLGAVFALLRGNIFNALYSLLEAGVGLYLLYEVREYFNDVAPQKHTTTSHAPKQPIDAEIINKK